MADLFYIPGAMPAPHVQRGCAFTLGESADAVQYPRNWLDQATAEDLAAIGAAVVVTEGEHGDPRLVENTEEIAGPVRRLIATARPAEEVSAALLAHLADCRWRAEIGGTVWNGWVLPTDERSQQKYAAEALAVQIGSRVDGSPWKFPHGFELLANAQVTAMATAARAHVLACYATEAELDAQIAGGTLTDFAAIDAAFDTAFPSPFAAAAT